MAGAAFQPATPASSKTWIGHNAEIESYLKSAPVTGMEELKVGVTRPRRAKLAPGGPVDAMAWKAVKPGPLQRLLGELQVGDRRVRARQGARARHGAADG